MCTRLMHAACTRRTCSMQQTIVMDRFLRKALEPRLQRCETTASFRIGPIALVGAPLNIRIADSATPLARARNALRSGTAAHGVPVVTLGSIRYGGRLEFLLDEGAFVIRGAIPGLKDSPGTTSLPPSSAAQHLHS